MAYGSRISAIASFDAKGKVAPLYLRIDGESLKVDSFTVRSVHESAVNFDTTVIDGGTRKQVRVAFCPGERVWKLVVPPYFDF